MRVLLVDDEQSLRVTLAANLEIEGFEVVEAENAQRALDALDREKFDVVLTDVRMPGMSGIELFQVIKRKHPGLPVILSTAFALEESIRAALRDGVFTVLPKPPSVGDVVATLTRAAQRPLVLVVADLSDSTVKALAALGLRARGAYSRDEALTIVESGEVDVCVIDIAIVGVELMNRARAIAPNVAFVAVLASDLAGLSQRGPGAFAHLRRPFAVEDLAEVVAQARRVRA
jgi:DNA-binding NtrC family response regulator